MQKCRKMDHKQLLGTLSRSPSSQTIVIIIIIIIIFDTNLSSKVKIRENIHPPQQCSSGLQHNIQNRTRAH
jgi:hypothetical protein